MTETTESIFEVLHFIQMQLKAPKNQTNVFGRYKYRSCEDILEAVKKVMPEGASVTLSDEIWLVGDRYYVKASATLYAKGQSHTCTAYAREADTKKGMDESQITGTASSYARKYALNGLFCIDDTKDADSDELSAKEPVMKPASAQPTLLVTKEQGMELESLLRELAQLEKMPFDEKLQKFLKFLRCPDLGQVPQTRFIELKALLEKGVKKSASH